MHGPNDPPAGLRCNPAKLLLDPYAKAIDGPLDWDESLFGYRWGDPDTISVTDSATYLPKCVVINPYFDWSARGFEALTQFTARLVKLRRDHPVFRRRRFFQSSRGG